MKYIINKNVMHGLKRLDAEEENISVPVHMAIKIIQI